MSDFHQFLQQYFGKHGRRFGIFNPFGLGVIHVVLTSAPHLTYDSRQKLIHIVVQSHGSFYVLAIISGCYLFGIYRLNKTKDLRIISTRIQTCKNVPSNKLFHLEIRNRSKLLKF